MKIVIVKTKEDLKKALKNKNTQEIIIENKELKANLRSLNKIKKAGPVAIAAVIAAIPLIPVSGGTSVIGAVGLTGGALGTTTGIGIIGLVAAIGGVLAIGIFTNWEEVELNGVFKLKRNVK